MSRWIPAYVALGSNLDDPQRQVEAAFDRLAHLAQTRLIARSHLYRATPMGPQDQPEFVNAVAALLTLRPARELLGDLKAIEREMGRADPVVRWGPRVIDLDLLLWNGAVMAEPGLTLPHPGILERNFVLYPLADIAPSLRIPRHGPVALHARRIGAGGLHRIGE